MRSGGRWPTLRKPDKIVAGMRHMRSRVSGGLHWLAGRLQRLVTERAVRVWAVLTSVVTVLLLAIAVWQLHDLGEQQTTRAMTGLTMVDQQLSAGNNRAIRHRIQREDPLLPPEGPFTPEDLGDYLDALESLASWWGRGLIDLDSIDEWYGDLISRTAKHADVRAYILEQQRENPDFYSGFEDLAKRLAKSYPPKRSDTPAIQQPPRPR